MDVPGVAAGPDDGDGNGLTMSFNLTVPSSVLVLADLSRVQTNSNFNVEFRLVITGGPNNIEESVGGQTNSGGVSQ